MGIRVKKIPQGGGGGHFTPEWRGEKWVRYDKIYAMISYANGRIFAAHPPPVRLGGKNEGRK